MQVLIIGGPTVATGSFDDQAKALLRGLTRMALADDWTIGYEDNPEINRIVDEVRADEKGGYIKVYALEATRTKGRSEDTGVIYAENATKLREMMAKDAEAAVFIGGIPFGQKPATDTMSPTLEAFAAINEFNPEIGNYVVTSFGGNTAEPRFSELVKALDQYTTFIDERDPHNAATALVDMMS